jgi:H+-transporting ATPase
MTTTALNPPSAEPRNSPSNESEGKLADKSGLTTQEAQTRLETVGPNSMPSAALHPLRRLIDKLLAPVPWMLEAAIVLQLVLHKVTEAAVIAFLLFSMLLWDSFRREKLKQHSRP